MRQDDQSHRRSGGGLQRDHERDDTQARSGGVRSQAGTNYGDFRGASRGDVDADNDVGAYYTGGGRGFEGSGHGDDSNAFPGSSGRFQPGGGYGGGSGGFRNPSGRTQAEDDAWSTAVAGGFHGARTGQDRGTEWGSRERNDSERNDGGRNDSDRFRTARPHADEPHAGPQPGRSSGPGRQPTAFGGYDNQGGSDWHPSASQPPSRSHRGHDEEFDPDYQQWRAEQMRTLDEDYRQWRKDRYKRFSDEFNQWRSSRGPASAAALASPSPTSGSAGPDRPIQPPGADGPATNPAGGDASGSNELIPMDRNPMGSGAGIEPAGSARPGANESSRSAPGGATDAGATANRV